MRSFDALFSDQLFCVQNSGKDGGCITWLCVMVGHLTPPHPTLLSLSPLRSARTVSYLAIHLYCLRFHCLIQQLNRTQRPTLLNRKTAHLLSSSVIRGPIRLVCGIARKRDTKDTPSKSLGPRLRLSGPALASVYFYNSTDDANQE